jgi:hypothetical protein
MRIWPSVAIAAVLAATVFGGYVVAAALETPSGEPVAVAGTVAVQPLSGWEAGEPFAAESLQGTSLTRGTGNLDVIVTAPAAGGVLEVSTGFVEQVLEPQAERLSVSPELEPVEVAGGRAAARYSYVGVFGRGGTPIEGEVTVTIAANDAGVVFDAWAPEGQLAFSLPDTRAMQDAAEMV